MYRSSSTCLLIVSLRNFPSKTACVCSTSLNRPIYQSSGYYNGSFPAAARISGAKYFLSVRRSSLCIIYSPGIYDATLLPILFTKSNFALLQRGIEAYILLLRSTPDSTLCSYQIRRLSRKIGLRSGHIL
jgi:hypothetical protein